ncbi:VOC family protein [Halomarina salina]|uniref:VOC family protein n=1 Tax=Halomarina salina TaxID=1872699 RepID=A0ABD5RIS4_9EURY|nr:VOC family protein [Halomarina salina]
MFTDVTHVTVFVDDQDEAIAFYADVLGFEVRVDSPMGDEGRWVTVAPPGASVPELTLVEADSDGKRERIGSQAADHVFLVLESSDLYADYERLQEASVEFHGEIREVPWGIDATFEDPWGNVYNVVEPEG